jgi:hypothetical protein
MQEPSVSQRRRPFGLFLRNFEPLAPPDALNPRVADEPAGVAQQGRDLAIAVAAIKPGQCNHSSRQPFSIFPAPRDFALRRAMLPERRTGATLKDVQMLLNMIDAGATTRGA